jgi:hypothetical protein
MLASKTSTPLSGFGIPPAIPHVHDLWGMSILSLSAVGWEVGVGVVCWGVGVGVGVISVLARPLR